MRFSFKRAEPQVTDAAPTRAEVPELAGADIAGLVHGQRVGGDFYQFARANPRRVLFGLLDVAGESSENRGIVAAANQTFRDQGPACLAHDDLNEADAMMEFCHELNVSIRAAADGVRSCAAFVGCYNEERGTVCYVNAGHTPGLLRYNSDISELPATGLPLGLFAASTYEAPTAAVPRGGRTAAGFARRGGGDPQERGVWAAEAQTAVRTDSVDQCAWRGVRGPAGGSAIRQFGGGAERSHHVGAGATSHQQVGGEDVTVLNLIAHLPAAFLMRQSPFSCFSSRSFDLRYFVVSFWHF